MTAPGFEDVARAFFHLPPETKAAYHRPDKMGQRGFTGFGTEHARDSQAPDLKEFWQIGRPDVPDDHPVHRIFGPNFWPAEVPDFGPTLVELYRQLDHLGAILLEAAALHVGEPADRFASIARDSPFAAFNWRSASAASRLSSPASLSSGPLPTSLLMAAVSDSTFRAAVPAALRLFCRS